MEVLIYWIIDTMELLNYNKHWNKEYYYKFKNTRVYFQDLVENLHSKFINLLIGLRRVWKTTLMLQLINHLIEKWVERDSILYYSFDTSNILADIINNYLKISNKDINTDTIYIFLDEIQKVDDWQNNIKVYYDLYPNIKFILSWSSSVFLKSTESLAGRIQITEIKPLFFEEYLNFRDKSYLLEKPKLHESNLLLEFEKYLYRQFYDSIDLNLLDAKEYTKNLKNKILKEDAKDYFNIQYPNLLLKLFDILAARPWMSIDYNNLWSDLWIDSRTVETYIYYLQESFLVNKVYNYSPNLLTSEKKQKKVYLKSTSFFTWNWEVTGELYENYIQNYFDFKYFYRFKKKEVDFVWVWDHNAITCIEVKYKETIKQRDLTWLASFAKKYAPDTMIVVSKNTKKQLWNITIIPFRELDTISTINKWI